MVQFLIFWLLKSTLGAKDTCTEAKCKLLVDGNDLAAEFQSKSSEDGVRMVYLHLNVGNGSNNPLESHDRFLPNRWTWARGVNEPMLYFSYQYQVLSLGLLKNQVRNIELTLSVEPPGCVANLTYSCKDIMVATTLLEKITEASTDPSLSEDVVCVSVVERDINWLAAWFEGNIQYHCCKQEQSGNETTVQCDLPVQYDRWYMLFYHVLTVGIIVLFFFWPAVIPWLKEQSADDMENNNNNIPVDDLSPNSCGAIWSKFSKSFRLHREVRKQVIVDQMVRSYYFRILSYAYIVLVLNYSFLDYLTEADTKNAFPENALFYYVFDVRSSKLYCLIPVIIFFIILPAIFIFFTACASEEIEQHISTKVFKNLNVFRELHLNFFYQVFFILEAQQNRANLKPDESVKTWSYRVVTYLQKKSEESRKILFVILFSFLSTAFVIFRVSLIVLAITFLIVVEVPLLLLCVMLLLAIDIIRWSPFTTLIKIIYTSMKKNLTKPSFCFCLPLFLAWLIYFSLAVIVCCSFYIRMFGFVVVGLIINAKKSTPYVAFGFAFTVSNISLCYNTFRKRFKEMKKIIFKYYKKRTTSLPNEGTTSKTIPEKLFWYICKHVLPIEQEIFAMLTSLLIISSISLLALAIIVFFGEVFNSSTLVQAGAVLLSGKLTGILFNGLIKREKFSGLGKIKKSKEIKELVEEWINRRVNEETTLDIED